MSLVKKTFKSGYYQIVGMPDNRSPEWFINDNNSNDQFLWDESRYESPLHQAESHCQSAVSRETRRDMHLSLSIAPEIGLLSRNWSVTINHDKNEISVSGNCEFTGRFPVIYIGPSDMFTYAYKQARCTSVSYWKRYHQMETLCESGDPRFKISKRSGIVMYAPGWPRYHSDGTFWDGAHENNYLSLDETEADEQWEYMFNREEWQKDKRSI